MIAASNSPALKPPTASAERSVRISHRQWYHSVGVQGVADSLFGQHGSLLGIFRDAIISDVPIGSAERKTVWGSWDSSDMSSVYRSKMRDTTIGWSETALHINEPGRMASIADQEKECMNTISVAQARQVEAIGRLQRHRGWRRPRFAGQGASHRGASSGNHGSWMVRRREVSAAKKGTLDGVFARAGPSTAAQQYLRGGGARAQLHLPIHPRFLSGARVSLYPSAHRDGQRLRRCRPDVPRHHTRSRQAAAQRQKRDRL